MCLHQFLLLPHLLTRVLTYIFLFQHLRGEIVYLYCWGAKIQLNFWGGIFNARWGCSLWCIIAIIWMIMKMELITITMRKMMMRMTRVPDQCQICINVNARCVKFPPLTIVRVQAVKFSPVLVPLDRVQLKETFCMFCIYFLYFCIFQAVKFPQTLT